MPERPVPLVEEPAEQPARVLVGLIGKKRSGKDTVAGTLTGEFGFVRYAFADPLKATMRDLDPIVDFEEVEGVDSWTTFVPVRLSQLLDGEGDEAAKERPEVRRLYQAHGVAIREHVDPDVWLHATMSRVAREPSSVVITDVRFPNEADAIREAGGILVRVERPSVVTTDTHISETALDDYACDHLLTNEGTLSDLRASVVDLAGRVLNWWS